MSADPDYNVRADQLRVGDEVEHYGQRCTVTKVRRVGIASVHVTLSNGRSGEMGGCVQIGVYRGRSRR